eukprot:COSAG02_NODE_45458_length_357_cov_0.593023_1_plen_90_part_10
MPQQRHIEHSSGRVHTCLGIQLRQLQRRSRDCKEGVHIHSTRLLAEIQDQRFDTTFSIFEKKPNQHQRTIFCGRELKVLGKEQWCHAAVS